MMLAACIANKFTEEVLKAIKRLAVWEENIMVAWVQLRFTTSDQLEMKQSETLVKLTYASSLSHARMQLQGKLLYTDNILCNMITCVLTNEEIQLDLLGERIKTWPWRRFYNMSKPKYLANKQQVAWSRLREPNKVSIAVPNKSNKSFANQHASTAVNTVMVIRPHQKLKS